MSSKQLKVLAYLCNKVSGDRCRQSLGLPNQAALEALIDRLAEAGRRAVERELRAQGDKEAEA